MVKNGASMEPVLLELGTYSDVEGILKGVEIRDNGFDVIDKCKKMFNIQFCTDESLEEFKGKIGSNISIMKCDRKYGDYDAS